MFSRGCQKFELDLIFSRRQVGVEAKQEAVPLVEHRPLSLFHGGHGGDDCDDDYDYDYDDKDDKKSYFFLPDNDVFSKTSEQIE